MEFSIKQSSPEKQQSDCVVIGVYEDGKLSAAAQLLDKTAAHHLSDLIKRGDMKGKLGTTLMLHHVAHIAAERVLMVGLGKANEFSSKQFLDVLRASLGTLQKTVCKNAALYLTDLPVKGRDEPWKILQTVLIAAESGYRCDHLKSKPADASTLRKIILGSADKPDSAAQAALGQATAIAHGMKLTKDLGNLPGNICTPTYLAEQAQALAKAHKLKATILEEKDMQKLGMNSLLSVTHGSRQPAKLITLEYHGGDKKQKPIVLVGKGITFDSGGISLKPGADMDEMKYDMCGAASVLGTMQAIAEMGHRRVRPGRPYGLGDGVEDGDPVDALAALAGRHAGDDVRAVVAVLQRVERPLTTGDALHDEPRLLGDQDRHVRLLSPGQRRAVRRRASSARQTRSPARRRRAGVGPRRRSCRRGAR